MKWCLVIAYDGTNFSGWQSQSSKNSIQDCIQAVLEKIFCQKLVLFGSGRTDAGVHALAQVAHLELSQEIFDSRKKLQDPKCLIQSLNAYLPPLIRVMNVIPVVQDFHARFSAQGKIYRYQIWNSPILPPFLYKRCWHVINFIDTHKIVKLSKTLEGKHDFRAFTVNSRQNHHNYVRTIHEIQVSSKQEMIEISFYGNGFLYRMIRMIVGGIIEVATCKKHETDFLDRFFSKKPYSCPLIAPPDGLYLVKVLYPSIYNI